MEDLVAELGAPDFVLSAVHGDREACEVWVLLFWVVAFGNRAMWLKYGESPVLVLVMFGDVA